MPWLKQRDVALLGNDGVNDVQPSGVEGSPRPIHQLAIVALGLPLVDVMDLEAAAETAARLKRWEFLLTGGGRPGARRHRLPAQSHRHVLMIRQSNAFLRFRNRIRNPQSAIHNDVTRRELVLVLGGFLAAALVLTLPARAQPDSGHCRRISATRC